MTDIRDPTWRPVPAATDPLTSANAVECGDACLDVLRVRLDVDNSEVARCESLLTDDERTRAARFRFDDKRREFTVTRAALRRVLSLWFLDGSDDAARGITLKSGSHGKPFLEAPLDGHDARFNVSHSADIALIAVATGRAVGVDVEHTGRTSDLLRLAERYFSPNESAALNALPSDRQRLGFFNCWTRKEAYLKAIGRGITLGLSRFDVSLRPGDEPRLIETRHDADDAQRWSVVDLPLGGEYVGAVVVAMQNAKCKMQNAEVRLWEV